MKITITEEHNRWSRDVLLNPMVSRSRNCVISYALNKVLKKDYYVLSSERYLTICQRGKLDTICSIETPKAARAIIIDFDVHNFGVGEFELDIPPQYCRD
jgi:hypothetical protein